MRTALLISTALIGTAAPAAAQQAWTGTTSTDWFTATNWSTGTVPANGDQPTVDTTNNAPVINGATAPAGGGDYPQIFIGNNATGALTIQNAGTINLQNAFIGNNAGSNGTVTMTDAGSKWNSTDASNGTIVGFNGNGTFNALGGAVSTVNTIVGFGATSNGTVTVSGPASWSQTGAAPLSGLFVGYGGTGTFTVQNGGTVNAVDTYVGHLAGSTGTATVTGAGSSWTGNSFFIGNGGNGTFNVLSGGTLTANADSFIGYSVGSTGMLNVDGAGSKFSLTNNKSLFVGGSGLSGAPSGSGTVNVTNGGTLDMNGSVTFIGVSGGTGTMNFDTGSTWFPGSAVAVGFSGTGIVNVAHGSVVTLNGQILVGDSAGSHGTVTVTGVGSQFHSIALLDFVVGQGGTGQFTVQNGATADLLGGLIIGADATSVGTVTVQNGSTFTTDRGNVTIGQNGSGTMNVLAGSSFTATQGTGTSADAFVGYAAGTTGTLNIDGGSTWSLPDGILHVGSSGFSGPAAGTGTVNITNGSTLAPSSLAIGVSGGTGTVNIDASTLNTGNLGVGISGTGALNVTNGGIANVSAEITVGGCDCALGTVTVSGATSQFNSTDPVSGDIVIGGDGTAIFNILNGATATFAGDVGLGVGIGSGALNVQSGGKFTTAGDLYVGLDGSGTLNVTGAGSQVNVSNLIVAESGVGTVNVTNGGKVNITNTAFIADCFCAVATVNVSGAGSSWTSGQGTAIGLFGTGQFNVLNGATAELGPVLLGTGLGTGTLKIDATSQATITTAVPPAYTQGANGTFAVGISPTGNGKLTVTGGDIDLTAGGALVVNAKTTVAKTYTIMTTNAAVTGTFGSVSVVGNANNLQVIYNPASVVLTVDTFSVANNLPSGLGGNPKHVADALDKAIASGITIPDAFFNVFALSGASLVNALSQLSGETAAGAQQSNIHLMNSFLSLMLNPFSGAASGNPGAIGFAREFGPGDKISPQAAAAYAAVTPRDKRADTVAGRWSVWGQAYGGYNKINGDATTVSHDSAARTYGLATGYDYRASPDIMVGFALAGAGENWGVSDGLGSGRGDAFQLGAYGSKQYGAAYLSGALSYAVHSITTDRTATVAESDHLTANFTAQSVGGRIETGYRFLTPYARVTPYAAAQVQDFFTPNYSENATSGSNTFALSYNSRSSVTTRTELGAWFDKALTSEQGRTLSLRLRAAWANDHSSDQGINAAFQTLPGATFTVNGAAPATNLALVTTGAELQLANNVSFGLKFDGEFADVSQTYAGTGTVRYVW